ncbi:hypothetical protein EV652_109137 [Kribbella steppae]|uniref:4-amino-4-deoxy-L-arabinose transferase-like glycosyltransferase n=1 Tax=Kribbella steppae TaxID=2512223 RepID=A0A4R2H950_9ACTN|nr:hypothetical protein [Kribbella steppae]TCO23312.1 hypothetical protein EV652_109137 [Kribbella steppae]
MRGIPGLATAPDSSVLRGVVVAIAVLQAAVLGLLARRGSWLTDDLDFLVQGGRGFASAELLTPVNDHIAPGLRFVYAVFAEVAPLNHDFTVAWRVVMQAVAIFLMGHLLVRLLGSSWWVVAGTLFYALTPLSMPSFMSLSSGVNNLSAHVFGLLLLHATIDWYDGHRRRAIAYGPLALLVSLACWEKSALILCTAVALALYLRDEPFRVWLRRTWPYAAALTAAVVAFGTLYLTHGNPSQGRLPTGELMGLIVRGFRVPLSALAGGPWSWADTGQPLSFAAPGIAELVVGGLVAGVLLLAAWRRDRRVLLLWAAVVAYVLVTVVLVSYGRFSTFGTVFTVHYHYWSDLSIPLTLAAVLSARTLRMRPVVSVAAIGGLVAAVVVSDAGFAKEWANNPAKAYFANVTAELDRAGPNVNLWDTAMPQPIGTALMTDSRLSPVLRMAGIPFQLQAPGSEPLRVDETGKLRPSPLAVWSRGEPASRSNPFCNLLLRGTGPLTVPLKSTEPEFAAAEWFVKAAYFSDRENQVTIELVDADGNVTPLPAARWPAGVGTMYLGPSRRITATEVRLRSSDPATNLCVENLEIGLPL